MQKSIMENEENFKYWFDRNVDRSLENNVFATDIAINAYNKAIIDILYLLKKNKTVKYVDLGVLGEEYCEILDYTDISKEVKKLTIK